MFLTVVVDGFSVYPQTCLDDGRFFVSDVAIPRVVCDPLRAERL